MATSNPVLARREIKLGSFSQFVLPEFPTLPASVIIRDAGERTHYEMRVKHFTDQLNTVLSAALSARPAT